MLLSAAKLKFKKIIKKQRGRKIFPQRFVSFALKRKVPGFYARVVRRIFRYSFVSFKKKFKKPIFTLKKKLDYFKRKNRKKFRILTRGIAISLSATRNNTFLTVSIAKTKRLLQTFTGLKFKGLAKKATYQGRRNTFVRMRRWLLRYCRDCAFHFRLLIRSNSYLNRFLRRSIPYSKNIQNVLLFWFPAHGFLRPKKVRRV